MQFPDPDQKRAMKPNIVIYRHQLFMPSEVFITQQAEALKGFTPLYCCRSHDGTPSPQQQIITLSKGEPWHYITHVLLRNPKGLAEKLRAFKPVMIHAHFGVEGVYALPLARALGIPLVTTFHGFDATTTLSALLKSKKLSWIMYALRRAELARRGDLFICVSDFIRDKVIAMGFPAERSVKHYIGIDVDALQAHPQRDSSVILHVARLVEKKGTRYLLQAFAQVKDTVPAAELVIIGDGPLRPGLQSLAQSLAIADRVKFLGAQAHHVVMDWMRRAQIFCLPSVTAYSGDAEGLGMVHLEAGAMGLPIVATWHNGFPEIIRHGHNGYLVPEKDPHALAQRLIQLLQAPDLCESMGMAGRRVIEEHFNIKRQTQKLEELYQGLLA
jgi:glycosyltransferase involved in cell wall biosynthesis